MYGDKYVYTGNAPAAPPPPLGVAAQWLGDSTWAFREHKREKTLQGCDVSLGTGACA